MQTRMPLRRALLMVETLLNDTRIITKSPGFPHTGIVLYGNCCKRPSGQPPIPATTSRQSPARAGIARYTR